MTPLISSVKTIFLAILFSTLGSIALHGQDSVIRRMIELNAIAPAHFKGNSTVSGSPVPGRPFLSTDAVLPTRSVSPMPIPPAYGERLSSTDCIDSSFFKTFEAANRSYSFYCSEKTNDGGIVLGGYGRDKLVGPPYTWYGTITKFDSLGQHVWSRELRSEVVPGDGLYIESISVLSDGSIILSGEHRNPLSTSPPTAGNDFFMAKLTATGDLVWLKTFHSLLGNGCSSSNIRFAWLAEGLNGDIFVGATVPNCPLPRFLLAFKLNSSGDVLWKYSFSGHFTASYCMGVFYDGNYITIANRGDGSAQSGVSVDFLRLDAATGAYISHKSWEPALPYPDNFYAGFLNWTPTVVRLNNGNYCLYGNTFGDFSNFQSNDVPHFSIIEFNANYEYVKGYTIHSTLYSNPYESKIKVNRFGHVFYSMTVDHVYPDRTKYFGIADNGAIVHQRKKSYYGLEAFYDNAEVFDDGSVAYVNNFATQGQSNFYLYYSLLHATDTSKECVGVLDNFSYTVPINYTPNNFSWETPNADPFIATTNQNNSTLPITYSASGNCYIKSYCDTLKIHGISTSCNVAQDFTFTAFRNIQCGYRIKWNIDQSALQSFQVLNDTTVRLRFNQAWQGWLYAEINTSCGPQKDSLLLTIADSPGQVDLGPDTTICPSNTIILNARKGYALYLWNDGSTDSLLTVINPGQYYVDVTDACGNIFNDTIIVAPAPPIPFDIGPDRSKCNNDTIHLTAPGGFINYSWGPSYNITQQTAQQAIVQPAIDTIYFVRAEKTPGCFAYDTLKVKVNNSPPIALGNDKSFCQGDNAVLDAGSGFTQYEWNNAGSSQQITVHTTGVYSVIGTTAEGCRSYDTLRIINVWNNPIVSLDDNPALCAGTARILNAGNFNSYQWQDGSTAASFPVTGIGTYHVTVWDDNFCKGSDTVKIVTIFPLPANFLPADTAICNYGNLLIKPTGNFNSYRWNNNAVSPFISITSAGLYWLEVTDANACIGKDSLLVLPKECLKGFYIPTGFTPDKNGLNDDFKPFIGGTVKHYQFTVYNRWGQVVFTTKDLSRGWNGSFGGTPQDANIYAWLCTYQLEGETIRIEKGTVMLVR